MEPAPQLIGRRRELAALAELIDRGSVRGARLAVCGDAGTGKSALLDAARRAARTRGLRVLTSVGVRSEASLPFAGLHQLLRPIMAAVAGLPPVQRDALLSALGRHEGPAAEPALVSLAAANLVCAVAADRAVVVLADDVQWLDRWSQEALVFLGHQAVGTPVTVIGAARDGHPGPFLSARFPRLDIGGLDDVAAQQMLLSCAGDLSAADRRRIQHEALGNPLALLELPASWRVPDPPSTDRQYPRLSARLERAFAGGITELPAGTRDAVLVAAVDASGDLAEILAATAVLHGTPAVAGILAPAAEARLLVLVGGVVEFRHPLVRAGVLQAETLSRRQAAHAALAAVLVDEPARRVRHRAESIVGPDDVIADMLEANVAAPGDGPITSTIADLARSAQLTSSSARRGHRLLLAAEQAFRLGHPGMVNRFLLLAGGTNLTDLDRARMDWLRDSFHDSLPVDAARVVELCGITERSTRPGDRDLALNLLLDAAMRCWWADTGPVARARLVRTAHLLTRVEDDPRYVAVLGVAGPLAQAGPVTARLSRVAVGDVADADALRLLGVAAHAVGDEVRAAVLFDRAESMLRDQGRLGLLPPVLTMQAQARTELGDWGAAAAAAAEGQRLSRETGQPIWSTGALICAARLHGLLGEVDHAADLAAEAELAARRQGLGGLLADVLLARGSAWLSAGRYADAYRELRRLFDPVDHGFHQRERLAGVTYLAEAAVRSGHAAEARAVVADLVDVAAVVPSPLLRVHLLHARAVLAPEANAEPWYRAGLRADLTGWPWIRARIELAYGGWLRGHGRSGEARPLLRSALAVLDRIGARAWADHAREVLATLD